MRSVEFPRVGEVGPTVRNRDARQGIQRLSRSFGDVIGDKRCALKTSSRYSQAVSLNPGQHRRRSDERNERPGYRDIHVAGL